ncbi:Protein SYS1 [Golovinomyces cichoracearum]|uniref:Protein SYS1 n=1 Tax=Golovinomyces cichoracearum TaxID=62708 RepID=A0A420HQV4_9PEZI|nr:Protein SYS1 [Golovinomyces cichoracearum]
MALRRRRPPRSGMLTEFPPLKILTQIFILQLVYYTSAFVLILFSALVAGKHFNLDLVLNWRNLRGDTTVGWMLGTVWELNSITGAIAILILVHRSKLVLDFALTLHFIHLITISIYSHSIPRNFFWWVLHLGSACTMIFLGIWTCQRRELRPMSFGADTVISNSHTGVDDHMNSVDRDNKFASGNEIVTRMEESSEAYEMTGRKNGDISGSSQV